MINSRWLVGALVGVLLSSGAVSLLGQEKKNPPASFSGRLMRYDAKKDTITHFSVLQPTPQGKYLQEVYELTVTRSTKFIVAEGDTKTELDSKTVLTDVKTKDLFAQGPGKTLNNNSGIPVDVETKGSTATKVTIKKKK